MPRRMHFHRESTQHMKREYSVVLHFWKLNNQKRWDWFSFHLTWLPDWCVADCISYSLYQNQIMRVHIHALVTSFCLYRRRWIMWSHISQNFVQRERINYIPFLYYSQRLILNSIQKTERRLTNWDIATDDAVFTCFCENRKVSKELGIGYEIVRRERRLTNI